MIFLSASIPTPGREYYGTENAPAIREAVMAFTKVCMELKLPFYFGGHPAISPLIYQTAKEYGTDFINKIKIYQSEFFKGQTPEEVSYFSNIQWTPKKEKIGESIALMREEMFKNPTECAVFIGGMNGIIDEAKLVHEKHPDAKLLPVINTGGACKYLEEITGFRYDSFHENNHPFAYVYLFRKYLQQFIQK